MPFPDSFLMPLILPVLVEELGVLKETEFLDEDIEETAVLRDPEVRTVLDSCTYTTRIC